LISQIDKKEVISKEICGIRTGIKLPRYLSEKSYLHKLYIGGLEKKKKGLIPQLKSITVLSQPPQVQMIFSKD
jgi:hypothetical protein